MIRIALTQAAFDAIAPRCYIGSVTEAQPDAKERTHD